MRSAPRRLIGAAGLRRAQGYVLPGRASRLRLGHSQGFRTDYSATSLSARRPAAYAFAASTWGVRAERDGTIAIRRLPQSWNLKYITAFLQRIGAAVASRFTFAALGSDTGGSIRLPPRRTGERDQADADRVSRYGVMPLSFRPTMSAVLVLRAIVPGSERHRGTTARPDQC